MLHCEEEIVQTDGVFRMIRLGWRGAGDVGDHVVAGTKLGIGAGVRGGGGSGEVVVDRW